MGDNPSNVQEKLSSSYSSQESSQTSHHQPTSRPKSRLTQEHPICIFTTENRDNSLREGVGEYSAEYSPYSTTKLFTPILPLRTVFRPIPYLLARPSRIQYSSQPPNIIRHLGNYLGMVNTWNSTGTARTMTSPPILPTVI